MSIIVWYLIMLHLSDADTNPFWSMATATASFSRNMFRTSFGSYRLDPASTWTGEWYDTSQILAYSVMAKAAVVRGDGRLAKQFLMELNETARQFLPSMRDDDGGYFALASLDGTAVIRTKKFCDDNALTGIIFLDAEHATNDNSYRMLAQECADYIIGSGLWDETCGGGFFWNTADKHMKPAQSNALVMQLMLRLGGRYLKWADKIYRWLTTTLQDFDGLLWWYVNATSGCTISRVKFAYDQGVMIQNEILRSNTEKAREIAIAQHRLLWDRNFGGFAISSAQWTRAPALSVWPSYSLLHLYLVDRNYTWYDWAEKNALVIHKQLGKQNGAYSSGCFMDGSHVSNDPIQSVDHSWMEVVFGVFSTLPSPLFKYQ